MWKNGQRGLFRRLKGLKYGGSNGVLFQGSELYVGRLCMHLWYHTPCAVSFDLRDFLQAKNFFPRPLRNQQRYA